MRRFGWLAVVVGVVTVATGGAAFGAASGHDKAVARAGVFVRSDFPSGWTSTAQSGSGSPDALEVQIVATPVCKPFKPLVANSKAGIHADSRDFTDSATTVSNDVVVYPTVADARKPLVAIRSPALSTCLQRLISAELEAKLASAHQASEIQNLEVAVAATNLGIDVGDDQVAFKATVTFTAAGQQASVYLDDFVVRTGRATDSISYENDTSPVTEFVPGAVTASVTRLQTALGG